MAGSHLLSVLSIYLISLAGFGTSRPTLCPTGGLLSVDPINPKQMAQIQNNQAFIEEIRLNPSLLRNPTYSQRSVVTLTGTQRQQILRNFPNVFQSEEEYLRTRGRISVPGEDGQDALNWRPGGNTGGNRVCKPVAGSQPLILAYHAASQQVVEIIQMPGQGLNQWILEESCDNLTNSPPAAFTCGTVERHVLALFFTLTCPYIFDQAIVVVESCVTIYN